jgi:Protein of unknown function with PCYCGC motif
MAGGGKGSLVTLVLGGLVALAVVAGAAWWARSADDPVTTDSIGDSVQTRRGGALPVFAASGETAELYRFARERGDVLQWMPCTCGCQQFGHTSNRSCYIKAETADTTTWTSHAAT